MLVFFFFALVELLGKIILHTHLADGMELAFQIIDMLFFWDGRWTHTKSSLSARIEKRC